jgi:small ligand-binding sensory domain FIST
MILLTTPCANSQGAVQAIQQATDHRVQCARTAQEASALLRADEYAAVVFDQLLLDAEPEESDQLLEHLQGASPIYVNFAIHGVERVARQVQAAMRRRRVLQDGVHLAAQRAFRSEISETVTAMLLSCDMALSIGGLPASAQEKLRSLHELTRELSTRLGQTP